MPVTTHIDQARERVNTEWDAAAAKVGAFDAFINRTKALSPEPMRPSPMGMTATAGTLAGHTTSTEDRCRAVRTAFAETIRPHSVDDIDSDESLLETLGAEFTETIAVALAPTTEALFTPRLKGMIITEAKGRRAEAVAFKRAVEREAGQLDEAGDIIDEITDWIIDVNETALIDLGFDALEDRHDRLESHRTRCEELARNRQTLLEKTTNNGVDAGVCHRQLILYLYGGFSVTHPVLATVAQLDAICKECQRAVRNHLVRRA